MARKTLTDVNLKTAGGLESLHAEPVRTKRGRPFRPNRTTRQKLPHSRPSGDLPTARLTTAPAMGVEIGAI
jgi:hypothetical protein